MSAFLFRTGIAARAAQALAVFAVAASVATVARAEDDDEDDDVRATAVGDTRAMDDAGRAMLTGENPYAVAYARARSGDAVNGEKLFRANFAQCFGWFGRGDGRLSRTLASKLPNLRDGETMNQLTDAALASLFKGLKDTSGKVVCPSGTKGFDALESADLAAYVRTLHPKLSTYYPDARFFTAKLYTIDEYGRQRMASAVGGAIPPEELKVTVFTLYRRMELERNDGEPVLVSQEPQKLDRLKREDRLGYLMFVSVPLDKFGTVPLAVALNNDGSLRKLTAVDATPETEKQIGFILGQFEGKGKRGGNYAKAKILFESRDRVAKPYSNTAFRLWMRVLEASFMFERDERDRTLLDDEINKSVSKKKPTAEDEEEEAAEFQMK